MTKRKISELPEAPYKKYASEAERRGIEVTDGCITDGTAVILIGALDMIRELYEKFENTEAADIIEAAMAWRKSWVDVEDLQEEETGCNCEVCQLIRACNQHALKGWLLKK